MTTKLLASIAVFALLAGVVSTSMMQSVYAAAYETNDKAMADKKAADAKKAMADKKAADAKKAMADKKAADAKKAMADKKAADAKIATAREASSGQATGKTSSNAVTVEMAKGSGSNTSCADKCYIPNTVQIKTGGTVTWKNVDTAAHTVTSGKDAISDGLFDSGMIMAGNSFDHKFDKAGTYDYYCMVHPWMKAKVAVS
jgi:plastocyanin